MYKPKRSRFLGYKGADYSEDSISHFIDDFLGGNGEFKAVGADLALNDPEGGKRIEL